MERRGFGGGKGCLTVQCLVVGLWWCLFCLGYGE